METLHLSIQHFSIQEVFTYLGLRCLVLGMASSYSICSLSQYQVWELPFRLEMSFQIFPVKDLNSCETGKFQRTKR